MKKFYVLSGSVGTSLLLYLVWKIGIHELWQEITLLWWGLLPNILLAGIVDIFHTLGWRQCHSGSQRSLPFLHIFGITVAGCNVNYP